LSNWTSLSFVEFLTHYPRRHATTSIASFPRILRGMQNAFLTARTMRRIEALLGPSCRDWSAGELAARLAEFPEKELLRVPRVGHATVAEIRAFIGQVSPHGR
jgi:hypothetical protein